MIGCGYIHDSDQACRDAGFIHLLSMTIFSSFQWILDVSFFAKFCLIRKERDNAELMSILANVFSQFILSIVELPFTWKAYICGDGALAK